MRQLEEIYSFKFQKHYAVLREFFCATSYFELLKLMKQRWDNLTSKLI